MTMRVIDFGYVSPLRSQTLWHAVARGVSAGAPPTLSFCRPDAPYVSLGYHRRFAEVDAAACRERKLPIFRRMVGGGPVYLDSGQQFFQVAVPTSSTAGSHRATLRRLLAPAVGAFRAAGVDADLDERGEIVVGDRKICGHAAGQIGEAISVVGNLIMSFDHDAAAATLRVPDEQIRPELARLMRRYVVPTPADPRTFRSAAVAAYAETLGTSADRGELRNDELTALEELDSRFEDPAWVRGDDPPPAEPWRVKIKSGVGMFSAANGKGRLTLSIGDKRVLRAIVSGTSLNGSATEVASKLEGLPVESVATKLDEIGPGASALAPLAAGAAEDAV